MGRKKQNPASVTTNGQGNNEPQQKVITFGPQLKFPWYYQPLQESQQPTQDVAKQISIRRDSLQLDKADKKMQKVTELRDKKVEPETQAELPFIVSATTQPSLIDRPSDLTPNDEGMPIKELPEDFIGRGDVKGFKFTQLMKTDLAYLYQVQDSGPSYYEIFERRINTQFGNVSYPRSEAFGRWAWTTNDLEKAMKIFVELNYRRHVLCV
jgi:hypothetical protein